MTLQRINMFHLLKKKNECEREYDDGKGRDYFDQLKIKRKKKEKKEKKRKRRGKVQSK